MVERAGGRDQLRLMTMASRLYHERGIRQRDIATQLGVSQPRVSRLLQQAEEQGIVRTVVVAPEGIYPEPEEALEDAYKLRECHVVEVFGGDEAIPRELGVRGGPLPQRDHAVGPAGRVHVVELHAAGDGARARLRAAAGGHARRRDARRPRRTRCSSTRRDAPRCSWPGRWAPSPCCCAPPGCSPPPRSARPCCATPTSAGRCSMLDELDLAFVGVGPADFHGPLREGDNFFSAEQLAAGPRGGRRRPARPAVHRRRRRPGPDAARRPRRRHHARPAARGAAPASSSRAARASGSPCTPRCAADGSTCSSPTSPAPAT